MDPRCQNSRKHQQLPWDLPISEPGRGQPISFVAASGGASAAQPFTAPQGRESYCGGTDLPASPWDTINPTGGGLDLNCFFSAKITPFWRLLCPSAEVWAAAVILQWMRAFLLSHIPLFPVCGVLAYHCVGDYPCKKARAWKTSRFQHLWTRFFKKCFSLYT